VFFFFFHSEHRFIHEKNDKNVYQGDI